MRVFVAEQIIFVCGLPNLTMTQQLRVLCRFLIDTNRTLLFFCFLLSGLCSLAQTTSPLTIAVNSGTVCAGTGVNLTVSGCPVAGAIRWSTGQTTAAVSVTPAQTTSYTAVCSVVSTSAVSSTVTSTSGTTTTATTATFVTTTSAVATVPVYNPILITPVIEQPQCNNDKNGRIVINATGGVGALQYQFDGQPFKEFNAEGSLRAGSYPVVVKDGIGCSVKTTVVLTQPPALSVSVTAIGAKCVGGGDGGLIATASGGVGDYRYSLLDVTNQQTTGTFINLIAGKSYKLIVSDKNNCVLFQDITIGQPASFNITLTPVPTRCAGTADGSVSVRVTGGSGSYQYRLGTGAFQTGAQFTGLAAGSYEFSIRDAVGCEGKQSVAVTQPAALSLTVVPKPVACSGPNTGGITVSATGGTGAVTYQVPTLPPQTGNVFSGLAVGTYTVVGTDANGCTAPASVTVPKVNPLKIQASTVAALCCSCPTGVITITGTGGTGTGRQYRINERAYQLTNVVDRLTPNTYRLRALDDGGCTDSIAIVVANANPLSLSVGTTNNVSCTGKRDGDATVITTGGTAPFTFFWQTETQDTLKARTASQTGLPEGAYTISVRDSNQCTAPTAFVTIKALNPTPLKPVVSATGSSTLTVNQLTGVQWYVRTGADPGMAIPNATGETFVPFASGQYYVITTQNGCASPPSDALNFVLTALNEPISSLSVRVVPNPIVDRLRIEIEQPERAAVQVQLLDVSGRVVRVFEVPAFTGKKQAEWPLNDVSTGVYLLKVATETRQSVLRVGVE